MRFLEICSSYFALKISFKVWAQKKTFYIACAKPMKASAPHNRQGEKLSRVKRWETCFRAHALRHAAGIDSPLTNF